MVAPLPADEPMRLASLYAHEILDTLPEDAWDNIVTLASQICEVPISAISLVDKDRQWFKAITGLDAQETGRDVAFCAHTILSSDALIVHDAREDTRFSSNPLVTSAPYIRFYAGFPISDTSGVSLGALCVIDQQPRQLTPMQMQAMHALANQVQQLLRLHKQELILQRQAQRFEAMAERHKLILSNISHEMRTPLNAIVGYTHLLRRSDLSPQDMDYTETIQEASDLLLKMVNNILDFAKIEAGKVSLQNQPLSLLPLCQNLHQLLALQAQQKGLRFDIHVDDNLPATVLGDPLKLQQILLNLLNNAIKFTDSGSVSLRVTGVQQKEQHVHCRFEVADTGPGIPEEAQPLLFEAFHQLAFSQTARQDKGTGLGLTISRELVHLMGGKLELVSQAGEGSRFFFTLAFEPAEEQPLSSYAPLSLKILVIDDHEETLQLLKQYLESWQCMTVLAVSPAEALRHYQTAVQQHSPFDALLVDWQMPEQDGVDFIARLQREESGEIPHLLLMTAHASALLMSERFLNFADGVLAKPILPLQLYEKLEKVKRTAKQAVRVPPQSLSTARQVLVVDDEPLNRHLMQALLTQYGAVPHCVASGIEALTLLQEEPERFALVFMDFHMPLMDGIETTRKIRDLPLLQALPIVALSANVLGSTRKAFLQAGGTDFLEKPIQPQALQETLQRYIKAEGEDRKDHFKGTQDSSIYEQLSPLWNRGLLDWDNVQERVLGNTLLLWQLLEQFHLKTQQQYAELQALLPQGYSPQLKACLHALKGNASNLSLRPLSEATQALEHHAQAKKTGDGLDQKYVAAFEAALQKTLSALALIFNNPSSDAELNPEASSVLSPEQLREALERLEQTLARYDVDAIDELSAWSERVDSSLLKPVQTLKTAVSQFDYVTARQMIQDLRGSF